MHRKNDAHKHSTECIGTHCGMRTTYLSRPIWVDHIFILSFLVFVGAISLVYCGCVDRVPRTAGTENGFIDGVSPALPACFTESDISVDDASNFWREANPNLFNCANARESITVTIAEIESEKGLDGAIGFAHYETNADNQIIRCNIHISPYWISAWDIILRHEVGHCLGLADDRDTGYIMDGFIHPLNAEISPNDAAIIESL